MHIPDGYLSPSTCATLYVFAGAGWYAALRRVKRALASRVIPLISVFAAFSFVVMLFNIPLPGGTTGHALGVTVAAIVLGPSASILAVSIALAIQALFFGDGGITTLGANCFNMAIVGSLVAYGAYHLIATKAPHTSRRRVFAAAIAGYAAINASAFLTAIEFGIQPSLFHNSAGAPLYAPYPLRIAVPAMMLGHLTFAGLAEAIISAGLVSYLQHADSGLLRGVQPIGPNQLDQPAARSPKTMWWGVALLTLTTPLGILAAGTAWGEWSSQELANPGRRTHIESASSVQPPLTAVPTGLQKLSTLWTAPFPSYAPRFIKSASFGYLMSAMFGVGLIALASLLANAFIAKRGRRTSQP